MVSRESDDTRTRILKSAWKLLEAGAGSEVRMSDIARAAGISRQALYLHFPSRAELLIATTRYLDEVKDVDSRLAASRQARSGEDRLVAFIDAWGNYIPEVYGVAKALLAMKDGDAEAGAAWNDRMRAVREGCAAAVDALARDGRLEPSYTADQATDLLATLLSVRNWEQLTLDRGWSQGAYIAAMTALARAAFVAPRR